jgi:hypothetical protein
VLDHFLLAMRNSELSRVVDVGTLHYYLDSTFSEHARGSSLMLQGFYTTMLAEPGIDPKMLAPPLLSLKAWEAKVGLRVQLPAELERLTETERQLHLARSPVQLKDVDRLLGRVAPPLGAPAAPAVAAPPAMKLSAGYADPAAAARAAAKVQAPVKAAHPKPKAAAGKASKTKLIVAVAGMVVTTAALAVSVYFTFFSGPQITEVSPASFAQAGLPAASALRKGSVVRIVASPAFSSVPRAEQTAAAERVLQLLAKDGVTRVTVVDAIGHPVAGAIRRQ